MYAAFQMVIPKLHLLLSKRGRIFTQKLIMAWTPLHWAASGKVKPKLRLALIKAGADIHAKHKEGWTPLHVAAFQCSY